MVAKHLFIVLLACFLTLQALAGPEGALSAVLPSETRMRNELTEHYHHASQEMAESAASLQQSLEAKGLSEEEQRELMQAWTIEHREDRAELKSLVDALANRTAGPAVLEDGLDPFYRDWHRYRRLSGFLPLATHWWRNCATEEFKTPARGEEWERERAALTTEMNRLAKVIGAAVHAPALRVEKKEDQRAKLVPNRPGTREALARIRRGESLLDAKEGWNDLSQEEKDAIFRKRLNQVPAKK